ncbi:hypothetical protein LZZ85_27430 [Terrimonas sp. NA20]|uniref:Uncharacterized protein n=1 Tax=Terrimonas ginsenosidimutans TaxID=2908004 RepID=A0ABS9L0D3_9BACT|nr:hypothetical protein [Terrimonas ginsenosidimutans]MCG2618066.1 hypothetical protein [Terrimonas ginsenosidimutans]
MKTIYTILFFLDLAVLILLAYLLLRLVDSGGHTVLMIAVCLGMIGSILLLGMFVGEYMRPQRGKGTDL